MADVRPLIDRSNDDKFVESSRLLADRRGELQSPAESKNRMGNFLKESIKSDIVLAVVLLLVLDLFCRIGFSRQTPLALHFDIPYRSRIWWAAKDFLAQKKTADVVLLGASDMASAVYGAEATYLNAGQNQLLKHRSEYLEHQLALFKSPYKSVFCLAIPGEMPSDAYFKAKTLLSGSSKPKVIVVSIAPRSLCDATFESPASTDIYRVMSKLGGTRRFELSCRSSIWDKIDYRLQQFLSIYHHKWEMISWQHHWMQAILAKLFGEDFTTLRTPLAIRKLALMELPEDYACNEIMSVPFDPRHNPYFSNLAEYRSRYRRLNMHTFTEQLAFLRDLCELCRSSGIDLVVVNTPLTDDNRSLMPPQNYALYFSQASRAVLARGASFVTLDLPQIFKHDDFVDSIHLNGRGGEKFLDQIALALSKGSQLAASSKRQPY